MYYKLFKNVNNFFETTIKRRKILDYRAFLKKTQWLTEDELVNWQWERLLGLLKHSFQNVPYWHNVFIRLGISNDDIRNYADFREFPIITKEDIRAHKEEMIAHNYRGKTWTKATGGSTGVPLELDYTPDSYDWRVAVSKRGYGWAGCEDGKKSAYIWGMAIGKVPVLKRIKESLHHSILRQRYYNCFGFTEQKMAKALLDMNRFEPECIVGYTNPLYEFAKYVECSGQVRFKPTAIISAAEKLISFREFNVMKKKPFLINTARGKIIDHVALIDALQTNKISGAGFDVLPNEPPDINDPILKFKNVIFSPHVAFHTIESLKNCADIVISNIQSFIEGKPNNLVGHVGIGRSK